MLSAIGNLTHQRVTTAINDLNGEILAKTADNGDVVVFGYLQTDFTNLEGLFSSLDPDRLGRRRPHQWGGRQHAVGYRSLGCGHRLPDSTARAVLNPKRCG
jgi:hypothetical protein